MGRRARRSSGTAALSGTSSRAQRRRRRLFRFVAVWTLLSIGLLTGTSSASADQLALPGIHLSAMGSWISSLFTGHGSFGNLPRQASGTAAGKGHSAPYDATKSDKGAAGHRPGSGKGELPAFAIGAKHGPTGPSATPKHGFDARTSVRVAAKSGATLTYYQNADGSVTRDYTQSPVNYRDAAGDWQPINPEVGQGSDGRWHETANSVQVDFANSAADPDLANFALDPAHSIGYALQGAAPVTPTVAGADVTYPGALPGTDLTLSPTTTGLKEALVLHSASAQSSWTFPLSLNGLRAELAKDGSIQLINTAGAIMASIPQAYAYDSKIDPRSGDPATTYAVAYSIVTVNGAPALRMSLDSAWLRNPARQFPVTVDPSFWDTPASTYTMYDSGQTNNDIDHSMEMSIKIGSFNSGGVVADSLLKFPTDLDNSGVQVNSAYLSLFDTWASICTAQRFDVAPITQAWTVSGPKNYPGPSYGASIGNVTPSVPDACANRAANREVGDWVAVNLAPAALQAWANGTSPDYGLAVYASTTDANHWKQFDSSNMYGFTPGLNVTTTGNVPPQVDTMYPGNGGVATSLTPTLIATGHDIDNTPGSLQYDFQVYNSSNTKVVDSGLVGSGNWTVPAGNLSYGQTYYWTVQAYDGQYYSASPGWNSLSVQVAQPAITSSLSQNTDNHGLDPSIGNYTTSATDAEVATTGPALNVDRDYNSRDPRTTGAFGAGWSSMFDARATEQDDSSGNVSTVVVTYPDGSQVGYGKNPDGTFAPPQGRFATFKPVTGGGYTLTDKNDTTYTFTQALGSGSYGISSVADANKRAVNFTWAGGEITTATSAVSGRALHLTWNTPSGAANPHVATVSTDPVTAGQATTALQWTYGYTGDLLQSVCQPASGSTPPCTQYGYTAASQYQNQVMDANPKSYWTLGEGSGTVAHSAVLANEGSDNATYSNVTLAQPGPFANSTATSAGFNGTTSFVQLPSSLALGTSTQTISMWFKTSSPNGVLFSYSALPLNNTYTYATGFYTPALYIGSDGKLLGEFWQNNTTPIQSGGAVDDGNWHQVVLTSAGNNQQMYLDGNLVGSLAGTVAVTGQTNDYLGGGYIGGHWPDEVNQSSTTNDGKPMYLNGSIADVSYTGQNVTQSQVSALYAAGTRQANQLSSITRPSGKPYATITYDTGTATVRKLVDENGGTWQLTAPAVTGSSQVYRSSVLGSGPAVYYRLGDTAGAAQSYDEVSGGMGTYFSTTLGVPGPFTDNTAASFNGTSSGVEMPDNLIESTSTLSTSLWFKTTSSTAGMLLSTGHSPLGTAADSGAMPVLYVGNDGKLYGHFWDGNTTGIVSANRVNDGNWHNVVLTGAVNTQTMYLDGQQVGTQGGALNNADPNDIIGAGVFNGRGFAQAPSNSQWNYFNGSISDVAIYHTALSAQQAQGQYLAARNSQGLAPMTTVSMTDPGNATITYQYDTLNGNRLIGEIDGLGHKTSYGYDTSGFLHTVTDPDGVVTTTGHDVRGNTVSQTTCQNQAGSVCSTAYYSYFPDDTSTQLTTADPRNDEVLTVRDGRSASATDNTYLSTYSYDSAGDRTGVTTPPVAGYPSGRTTAITYSDGTATFAAADSGNAPQGLPVKTVSAGGTANTITYFHDGDVASTTNADGLVTKFSYDGVGRLASKTEYSDSYPNGLTTSYTYDGTNQVVSQTDPQITDRVTGAVHSAVTTTSYDPDGNVLSQSVADGSGGDAARGTSTTYNNFDEVATETDGDQNVTSITYDAYGNKQTETAPDGTKTTWTYDPNGKVLTEGIDYTGSPLNPQPSTFLTEQSRSYDPAGRLASMTDSMGNVTKYTYFDNGLTATVTRYDPALQNSFVVESDSYDAAGNVAKKVTNNGATTDNYTVDASDRVTQTVEDPGVLARTTTVSYTPDDEAATTTQTDASGFDRTSSSTYDPMGNLLSTTLYGDSSGHPVGWWPLSQTGGNTVTDASGTGNTASVSGNVTLANGAASFPGVSGQQIATNGPVLNTGSAFSVSAWVDLASTTPGYQTAVSQDGSQDSGFYLQYEPVDNAWAFSRVNSDTANAPGIRAHATTPAQTGVWTHLVGVFDSNTGSMSLYVNGALAGTTTDTTAFNTSGPLAIGRARFNAAPVDFFGGQVSNVQVYQRALSASDVGTLYNGGRTSGTVASTQALTTSRTLDQRGLPTSMKDPDGNVTQYSYDEAGQLAVTTDPSVLAESNGAAGTLVHPVTTTGYNTFGEAVESQDPDGNVTTTAYDADGNPTMITQPNYTPPGASAPITAITTKNYDKLGELTSVTDPLTHTTAYTYDQLGDVVRETDRNNGNTDTVYDTNGEKQQITDPTGAVSQATYDFMGRQLTSTTLERYPTAVTSTTHESYTASALNPDGAFLASETTQDGAVTSYGYDNLGEQTSVTDAAGNTTHASYNFLGDKQTTTLADGSSTTTTYDITDNPLAKVTKDPLGNVLTTSSSTFDDNGNLLSSTDPNGHTSTFQYDATGALTQEIQPVDASKSITTSFGYDAAGNRTRFTDGRQNKWITTYNTWNQPESTIEPATSTYSTPANSTFTTSYDADGRPVGQTQPGGVSMTASYDNNGNLLGQTGSGAEIGTASRTFGYDADNRMKAAQTTAVGTSGQAGYQAATSDTFSFNDRGELLTTTGSAGSSSFGYNPDGLVTSRTDAAGTTGYGYDNADRLSTVTDAATTTQLTYSYNNLNQVSGVAYGNNGDTRTYSYNNLHQLAGDTLKTSAGATVASIGYTYDNNGNLKTKNTTGFDGSAANTYTYDWANRLTSWNNGSATVNYGYDDSGNRTQVGANVYTYDARDELTSDGINTYNYTARGTMSSQSSQTAGTTNFASDAYGQMISEGTQNYNYDALARTLSDTTTSGATFATFSYSGTSNTVASDGTDTYTYDPSGGLIGTGTAASGGGTTSGSGSLVLTDQHNDVVGDFTATAAQLAGSTTYDPLGNVLATSNQQGQLGYQSGWTDKSTGKVNMAARWYNPATGQFMNKDTVANNPVPNSAEANPYAYVDDNPMLGTDPTGHGLWDWISNNIVKPVAHVVNRVIVQPVKRAVAAINHYVVQPIVHAVQTVVRKVVDVYHAAVRVARRVAARVVSAVRNTARAAVHFVSSAYHAVAHAVTTAAHAVASAAKTVAHAAKTAATATVQFVQHHASDIAAFAAGAVTFAGCEGLTLGVGTIGCAALAGMAGSAVSYGMTCKNNGGCSVGGALEAVGLGAVGGVLGAGVGALAGPLISSALSDVLPSVVVAGITGATVGATAGAATAAAGYGMTCGKTPSGCSWGGLASAAATGAASGAVGGALGGAAADAIGSARTALGGGKAPAAAEPGAAPAKAGTENSESSGCHSFAGSTQVLMADGSTKSIDQVHIGDKISNALPGSTATETHTVQNVIVTETDKNFVDVTVAPKKSIAATAKATLAKFGKAAAGVAVAAVAVTALATPATAAPAQPTGAGTLTTTDTHPFYDITQAAFVPAGGLHVGDDLQSTGGTTLTITALRDYRTSTVTYDLTINGLHTYYVQAGADSILVHNCGGSGQEVAADYRANSNNGLGVKKSANIAVSQYEINGESGQHIAVSGEAERPGAINMPAQRQFDYGTRPFDSETKIFETHAANLGPDATGTIDLYSERIPCPSCQGVIGQFKALFPGIQVNVTWGDGNVWNGDE